MKKELLQPVSLKSILVYSYKRMSKQFLTQHGSIVIVSREKENKIIMKRAAPFCNRIHLSQIQ
jgi:hypothetical protein